MKCVLCARRNRQTEAETHVCVACAGWLQREVAEITRLAADAAAWVAPGEHDGQRGEERARLEAAAAGRRGAVPARHRQHVRPSQPGGAPMTVDGHECIACHRRTPRAGCCWRCLDQTRSRLDELHRLVLLMRQSPTLRAQQLTVQESRGSGGPGTVLNLEVADLIGRHGVQAVMLEWCAYISETRSVTEIIYPPKDTREAGKSLWDTSIAFLQAHLEWLSQQGDIWNDFVSEVTTPWAKLRQIIHGDRRPPKPVPCPVLDCTGTIRLHPNGDAACRHDNTHYWTYDNWSQLALLVAQEHK